jgi:hypothetical protein
VYAVVVVHSIERSGDISVGITTDFALNDRGSIPGSGKIFFFTRKPPDHLWIPPSFLSNGHWWIFPQG